MALSDLTAAERHRRIASDFADLAQRVADWDAPTPVADWTARDVVTHLVTCRFYTADIFIHSWNLARATGQHVTLEPELCSALLAGMEPMEEAMRSSGQYASKIEVPADADPQTRLIGFIGRDPSWQPDTPTSGTPVRGRAWSPHTDHVRGDHDPARPAPCQ